MSIQAASPEASQWEAGDYLIYDCLVAEQHGEIAGFLVTRQTAPGERELLNLAVDPAQRRRGVGQALVQEVLKHGLGTLFLEVRESNAGAIRFYERAGFRPCGRRQRYYQNPAESGIVMKFES